MQVRQQSVCHTVYGHPSKELYVLASLIIGDAQKTKDTIEQLNKEFVVKITGKFDPGSDHSFLGRRLRRNSDSFELRMPQQYIEDLLGLYKMNTARSHRRPFLKPCSVGPRLWTQPGHA